MGKFEKKPSQSVLILGNLNLARTLFHNLGNDDIYMKVAGENKNTVVLLMTGELDGFFKDNEAIVVDGTLVWENK